MDVLIYGAVAFQFTVFGFVLPDRLGQLIILNSTIVNRPVEEESASDPERGGRGFGQGGERGRLGAEGEARGGVAEFVGQEELINLFLLPLRPLLQIGRFTALLCSCEIFLRITKPTHCIFRPNRSKWASCLVGLVVVYSDEFRISSQRSFGLPTLRNRTPNRMR